MDSVTALSGTIVPYMQIKVDRECLQCRGAGFLSKTVYLSMDYFRFRMICECVEPYVAEVEDGTADST
jgi:hypothetical protein